jgi:hypothetical protein
VTYSCLVAAVLYLGWRNREAQVLTAESGLGYALGIVGSVMMLLVLLYPLRKKLAVMRRWARVKLWFRGHMVFGVVGPVVILYHANFSLGSLNSNVALFSMLLVVFSGLIGRYIYSKIHNGLYGERATLAELQEAVAARKAAARVASAGLPVVLDRLAALDTTIDSPRAGLLRCARNLLLFGAKAHFTRWRLERLARQALQDAAASEGWHAAELRVRQAEMRELVGTYFATLRRIAEFSFYERLFALWHILHMPIYIFLLLAAPVHILAVHLY